MVWCTWVEHQNSIDVLCRNFQRSRRLTTTLTWGGFRILCRTNSNHLYGAHLLHSILMVMNLPVNRQGVNDTSDSGSVHPVPVSLTFQVFRIPMTIVGIPPIGGEQAPLASHIPWCCQNLISCPLSKRDIQGHYLCVLIFRAELRTEPYQPTARVFDDLGIILEEKCENQKSPAVARAG